MLIDNSDKCGTELNKAECRQNTIDCYILSKPKEKQCKKCFCINCSRAKCFPTLKNR